jgi:hypothetical protein
MRRHIEFLLSGIAIITLQGCASGPRAIWSIPSPDRRHRVELMHDGEQQWLAIDGQNGPFARAIAPTSVVWSPEGGHVAYIEVNGSQARVVHDGCAGRYWDGVAEIAFSADGSELAYVAESRGRYHVVRSGIPGPPRSGVLSRTLRFSPDGAHLYYVEGGPPYRLVVDERPFAAFDGIAELTARNGEGAPSYAYLGRRGDLAFVVTEHGEEGPFHSIVDIARDPATGSTAWVVDEGSRALVYRDGAVVDARFAAVQTPTLAFRPARPALPSEPAELAYVGVLADRGQYVVVGGATYGPYSGISSLSFSENGERFGYAALRRDVWEVHVDGRIVARDRFSGPPVFSPNGRRFGRFLTRDDQAFAVVDGRTYALEVALLGTLSFSKDSQHWALIAGNRGQRKLYALVDGRVQQRVEFSELTVATLQGFAGSAPMSAEFELLLAIAHAEAELASGAPAPPFPKLSATCPRSKTRKKK